MDISKSNNLLIIPDRNIKPLDYLCLVCLVTATRDGKGQTHIALSPEAIQPYTNFLPLPKIEGVELKQKISPKRFIMTFKKDQGNVENIQWHQSQDDISIYVSMEDGQFRPEGMGFKTEGSDYDTILYFNTADTSYVASVLAPYPGLSAEVKHAALGKPIGIEHQEVELVDKDSQLLSEAIYKLAKSSLNKNLASKLVAAIMMETKRFRKPITGGRIFRALAELMEQGGDLTEANSISDKLTPKPTGSENNKDKKKTTEDKEAAPTNAKSEAPDQNKKR